MRRASRARSNRIVSCGSQASAPPAATSSLTSIAGVRPERAVDLLGRRGGDDEPRALADRDVEIEAVAAGNAAGGVDDHGFKLGGRRAGTAHAQRARPRARCARRVLPGTPLHRERDAAGRAVGGEDLASLFAANAPVMSDHRRNASDRHRALERGLVHGRRGSHA